MGARVAVGLVAVLVLGWLAVMERDLRLQARGVHASGRLEVAGNAARADSALRAARLLNPDTAPDLIRAVLYQGQGRERDASALIAGVLRREPDNLAAWGQLYLLTRGSEPATARRALAAAARLDPLSARRRRSSPRRG
jgi:hypothetical protein